MVALGSRTKEHAPVEMRVKHLEEVDSVSPIEIAYWVGLGPVGLG